jgi:hypothetical protein
MSCLLILSSLLTEANLKEWPGITRKAAGKSGGKKYAT